MPSELVLIAGMGRSGTSAVTRLLSLCGASLPPNLVQAAPDNPRGFWEPLEAVILNDRYLGRNNSSWYDPSLTGVHVQDRAAFSAEIVGFLRRSFGEEPVVILKEPRILSFFELWLRAIETAGFTIKVVHIFRHPDEVVASLRARDGLASEHAQVLWLKYNLAGERYTRHLPRMFISYAEVLVNPAAAALRCIHELELPLSLSDITKAQISNFINPMLRHQVASGVSLTSSVPDAWITRTYAALIRAAQAGIADTLELDEIFKSAERWQSFYRAADRSYDLWRSSARN